MYFDKRGQAKRLIFLMVILTVASVFIASAYTISIEFFDPSNEAGCSYLATSPTLDETTNPSFASLFNASRLCCNVPVEGNKSYSAKSTDDSGASVVQNDAVLVSYDGNGQTCACNGYTWNYNKNCCMGDDSPENCLGPCGVGTRFCSDNICASNCSSHNGERTSNGDLVCDSGESCRDPACEYKQDNCAPGLMCIQGTCQPDPSGCGKGTTLCADGTCSADTQCSGHGGQPSTNNDGVCNSGEGCNSADCDYRQDSCKTGLFCIQGICNESDLFWQDYYGNVINSAGVGWTVKLVYVCNNASEGQSINFEIFGENTAIRTGADALTATCTNGKAVAPWLITSNDLSKTTNKDKFNFKVSVSSAKSAYLTIDPNWQNNYPVSNITSPLNGEIYYANTPIIFNHRSYDKEGPITVEWNISDTLSNKNMNSFNHSYTTPGLKQITLKVTDNNGLTSESKIFIVVLGDSGTSAVMRADIDRPTHNQGVTSNELIVEYSANISYVIRSDITSPCTVSVNCVAGNCPSQTSNSPTCTGNVNNKIAIGGSRGDFSKLLFNWTFRNEDGTAVSSKQGFGNVSGRVGYSDSGNKMINLILNYADAPAGISLQEAVTRQFVLYGQLSTARTVATCTDGGTKFIELGSGGNIIATYDTLWTPYCAGQNQIPGDSDDCCPSGWKCFKDSENTGGCRTDLNLSQASSKCADYNSSADCENDTLKAAFNEWSYSALGCGTTQDNVNILCRCRWNSDTNSCGFGSMKRDASDPSNILSECIYNSLLGECNQGYQTIDVSATPVTGNDIACENSSQVIPCEKSNVLLPFFGVGQFLICLFALLVIYYIYFNRLKKK